MKFAASALPPCSGKSYREMFAGGFKDSAQKGITSNLWILVVQDYLRSNFGVIVDSSSHPRYDRRQ